MSPAPGPAPADLLPELAARTAGEASSGASSAASPAQGHAVAVRQMFDRISPTYDLLNRLLSAGIDQRWRARALSIVEREAPRGALLDSCAGTLDFAAALVARFPDRKLIAGDFARDMLVRGRNKPKGAFSSVVCDAMRLPFVSDAFAAMTCGFGMRNLADPRAGVREAFRVLQPGGVFVVLEFFKPTRLPTRVFHACYARGLLPLVGGLISGDRQAYRYLSDSMQGFLTRAEFEQAFRDAGFRETHASDLTLGIASIVWGRK